MCYELIIDRQDGIIYVQPRKPAKLEDHVLTRREIARICREIGYKKVLFDFRDLELEGGYTTRSLYELGSTYLCDGIGLQISIAHVMPRNAGVRREIQFLTTVAKNRGTWVESFEEVAEAERWLRGPGNGKGL